MTEADQSPWLSAIANPNTNLEKVTFPHNSKVVQQEIVSGFRGLHANQDFKPLEILYGILLENPESRDFFSWITFAEAVDPETEIDNYTVGFTPGKSGTQDRAVYLSYGDDGTSEIFSANHHCEATTGVTEFGQFVWLPEFKS